ncbi:MAG: haloacid dehalogenase-like hydrolase [Cyclobacteriaceae bacterium]|nr:haloacid dehalogenase-like hydrolase [Cyclobacteriaceae bacterium]
MKLILFDFDGTITNRDTLFAFTRFTTGNFRYIVGLSIVFPILVLHKIGLINSHLTKEFFLKHFFRNFDQKQFEIKCHEFCEHILPNIIRKDAYQAIKAHKQAGDKLVIVSASPENWILPWANREGIQVISTKLAFSNGKYTGKLGSLNCNGLEKANRIKQELRLNEYAHIIAYGDSPGDWEMFRLAHEHYFKIFTL